VPMMPALDGSGASLLQGAYAQVELGANGAPIGAVSVEADGVDPRPGDDAGSPLRDLCMVLVLVHPGALPQAM
jgi:hypothetical protein